VFDPPLVKRKRLKDLAFPHELHYLGLQQGCGVFVYAQKGVCKGIKKGTH